MNQDLEEGNLFRRSGKNGEQGSVEFFNGGVAEVLKYLQAVFNL